MRLIPNLLRIWQVRRRGSRERARASGPQAGPSRTTTKSRIVVSARDIDGRDVAGATKTIRRDTVRLTEADGVDVTHRAGMGIAISAVGIERGVVLYGGPVSVVSDVDVFARPDRTCDLCWCGGGAVGVVRDQLKGVLSKDIDARTVRWMTLCAGARAFTGRSVSECVTVVRFG